MKNILLKIRNLYKSIPLAYKKFALVIFIIILAIYAKKKTKPLYTEDLLGKPQIIINGNGYEAPKSKAPNNKTGTLYNHDLDRVLGDIDAPVTIVEYSSFFCPHCKTFNNNISTIKNDYIDTGKVKYVKRLVIQNETLPAVLLTYCVNDENYIALVDDLFANTNVWSRQKDGLKKIALNHGLTEADFNKCVVNKDLSQKLVDRQINDVKELFLHSTPTIFINGERITGSMSYSNLKSKIDSLL